jgi:hypothetical protein
MNVTTAISAEVGLIGKEHHREIDISAILRA